MRSLLVVVSLLLATHRVASAGVVSGSTFGVQPAAEIDHGGLGMWLAGTVGDRGYVGGEIQIGSYVTPDDAGVSYHAIAGVKTRLADRAVLLTDVGAGVSQQFQFRLGLFGSEGGFETERWLPSGAARIQLVGEVGKLGGAMVGLALASEGRVGRAAGETVATYGLGIGLVLSR